MGGLATLYRSLKGTYRESSLKRKEKRVGVLADVLSKFTNVGKDVNANRAKRMKEYEALLDQQETERKEFLEASIDSDIAILEKAAKENNIKI